MAVLQVQVSILLIPELQEEEEEETTYRHFNGDSGQWCRELNPGRDDGYGETSNWDRVIWNTRNAKVGSAEKFHADIQSLYNRDWSYAGIIIDLLYNEHNSKKHILNMLLICSRTLFVRQWNQLFFVRKQNDDKQLFVKKWVFRAKFGDFGGFVGFYS